MKKLFKFIFKNEHKIFTNTVFFTILLMLLYVLVLLPFMIYFFVQNPNVFNEADAEIYLNKNELYQFASSMSLYAEFFVGGAICELIRRAISTKKHILHDSLFMSYVFIIVGQLCEIVAAIIMMVC